MSTVLQFWAMGGLAGLSWTSACVASRQAPRRVREGLTQGFVGLTVLFGVLAGLDGLTAVVEALSHV